MFYYEFSENSENYDEIIDDFKKSSQKIINDYKMSNEKLYVITNIEFKRSILWIEGDILNKSPNKNYSAKIYSNENDEIYFLEPPIYEDKKLKIQINILTIRDNLPIMTGDYSLIISELFEEYHDEEYYKNIKDKKVEISIKGNKTYALYYDDNNYYEKTVLIGETFTNCISPEYDIDFEYSDTNKIHWCLTRNKDNFLNVYSNFSNKDYSYQLNVSYKVSPSLQTPYWNKYVKKYKAFKSKHTKNIKKIKSDLKLYGMRFLFRVFLKMPKSKKKSILFTSGSRAVIGGNEKFINNKLIELGLNKKYKLLYDFKPTITTKKSFIEKVIFVYRLAIADIIILDDYYPEIYYFDYPKEKKIVQVWHACGAFKTIGLERVGKSGSPNFNTRVHRNYTHVPVSSEHSARHNAEAFGISYKCFYPIGVPRTDIFFDEHYGKNIKNKLLNDFPAIKDKNQVILYAPTFRGINATDAYFPFYEIDTTLLGDFLSEENSILLIKMHPFVKAKIRIDNKYKNNIIIIPKDFDVNDILFITDILITDYSSIIYEFSLLNRPMIFYAFDKEEYIYDRDFYEPFEQIVPGKIVETLDELILAIKNKDYDFHKIEGFIEKNFKFSDGKSTQRFIEQIILED